MTLFGGRLASPFFLKETFQKWLCSHPSWPSKNCLEKRSKVSQRSAFQGGGTIGKMCKPTTFLSLAFVSSSALAAVVFSSPAAPTVEEGAGGEGGHLSQQPGITASCT